MATTGAATIDVTAEEFGNWLRGLPQSTLVGVQVTTADPVVLAAQNPVWQYLNQTRERAVTALVLGYQNGQLTDTPWMTTFNAACAAAFAAGALISAVGALTQFGSSVPTQASNIEEQPMAG